jgi:hypothetical protein
MSLINKLSNLFKKNNYGAVPQKNDKFKAHDYIGKFVQQSGTNIGESIAIEKDRLVVKSSDIFMSIPLEKIVTNTENIVIGDFNREESIQFGKEWFEKRDTLKFDKNGMMILSVPKSQ